MSSVDARALRLFDRYIEMSSAMREASLAALRREDEPLHDALVVLLGADAHSHPLDRAPISAIAACMHSQPEEVEIDRIGRQAGRWTIVGVIGHGGMGAVYKVERNDSHYQQTAALKYVRAGVSSPAMIEAFLNERNVLASLSHPGIVPLMDGGVDEDGQPWFVMQQVEGEPIDKWCDRMKLRVRERVELLVRACDAVIYAHARGILHQDIKPSNLLVTADGHIQLVDFGLSSSVANTDERKRLAVTSGYTAPEVLRGESPGFGVDVYSLGTLLWWLLYGQPPVPPRAGAPKNDAAMELVGRMTPRMVSDRGATGQRGIGRVIKGELTSILMRSVDPDPERRYGGVDLFRSDLQNWLSGYPVAAHDGGRFYRLRRFIRRNAYSSSAVVVIFLAILAACGVLMWEKIRAEEEQVAASHVDRLLESTMGMATLSGLGDTPLTPATMLERSEKHLRSDSLAAQPDVRSRGFSVLARSWAAIGNYDKAESLAEEAAREGAEDVLLSAFNLATLAQIQNHKANYPEAEASARKGESLLPIRLSEQYRLARVRLMAQLAVAQSGQGLSKNAMQTLSEAIAEAEKLPAISGNAVVAQLLTQRGTWHRWRFKMGQSEADLVRAIELTKGTDPVIADDARESLVRTVRASRKPGREVRSLALANELLQSRQKTLGAQHLQTGAAWSELAFIRLLNADKPGAAEAVVRAREILLKSIDEDHPLYARTCIAQAFVESLSGRLEEAVEQDMRGYSIYQAALGDMHELTLEAKFLLASLRSSQASMTGDLGRRKEAIELMDSAIADSVEAHGTVASIHRMAYASMLTNTGDLKRASKQLAQAKLDAVWQYGLNSQEALVVRATELDVAIADGRDPVWIEQQFTALITDVAKVDTLYARAMAYEAWLDKGQWLAKRGDLAAARSALQDARREAGVAGQEGWMKTADLRLAELQQPADKPGALR